jgi:phosphoribosyl-AMP cyclohydrolase
LQGLSELKYGADGLIPAVVVDVKTNEVLMVAYMNDQSLRASIETGKTHFWSRSRQKYWMKGESSGHVQEIHEILTDCDKDTLVIKVTQIGGAACHEGFRSCFSRRLDASGQWQVVGEKVFDPEQVYGKKH